MTDSVQSVPDRRADSQHLIDELVAHRSKMLSCFNDLLTHRPFKDDDAMVELLNRFCNQIIDYTADAHFRLYRYIEEGRERRQAVLSVAERVYGQIMATTDHIINFNDRYGVNRAEIPFSQLEHDMSVLGEQLADRIEQEDQLIAVFRQLCR